MSQSYVSSSRSSTPSRYISTPSSRAVSIPERSLSRATSELSRALSRGTSSMSRGSRTSTVRRRQLVDPIPLLKIPRKDKKRRKKKKIKKDDRKVRQPRGYTPTLGAVVLGITAKTEPKMPKGRYTGAEIRPVVVGNKRKKRKRR